jgi:hypothetical protein
MSVATTRTPARGGRRQPTPADARGPRGNGRRGVLGSPKALRLVYPAVLVVVTIGLSAAGVSGSSVGVITAGQLHGAHDPALIAGTPRPIRSDEWNIATPLLVAQSHHGFARFTPDELGSHDLTVVFDVPNTDWSTIFKPWDIPPLVLDVEHGYAARWWMMSLILLLGAYMLLLALTDRTSIAVLFSLGLWLSPFFHWWYESISLDSAGLGMLALAAMIHAWRAASRRRRAGWLALSAYATVGFVLLFYPPFQVPIALVMITIGLCEVIGNRSVPWRRIGSDVAAVAAVALVILGVFYLHARPALRAVSGTVYPGRRHLTGGVGSLTQLLSTPFELTLARHGAGITPNQSEISSFLLLGPFALFQMQRVRLREFARRWRVMLVGLGIVFVVLMAWYLISLPPVVATLLQLNRVQPVRCIIGVGAAGILLMAVFCAARFEPRADAPDGDASGRRPSPENPGDRRQRMAVGAAICGAVAFALYFWAGRALKTQFPFLGLSLWKVGLYSAGAAVVVLLLSARRAVLGGLALVLFGAAMSLPANPLYQGLGPLTSSPLLTTIAKDAARPPDPANRVWLSFESPNDVLIASGVPTLNAVDLYPVASAWRILDPRSRSVSIWDRYANMFFAPGAAGTAPSFRLPQADVVVVTIDPCGTAADRLGVGFVVSAAPLDEPCLALDTAGNDTTPYIYVRSPGANG